MNARNAQKLRLRVHFDRPMFVENVFESADVHRRNPSDMKTLHLVAGESVLCVVAPPCSTPVQPTYPIARIPSFAGLRLVLGNLLCVVSRKRSNRSRPSYSSCVPVVVLHATRLFAPHPERLLPKPVVSPAENLRR